MLIFAYTKQKCKTRHGNIDKTLLNFATGRQGPTEVEQSCYSVSHPQIQSKPVTDLLQGTTE